MPELSKFQQRLAERQAQKEKEAREKLTANPQHDADLIPEEAYERSEEENQLDAVIEGIDIVDAYVRWCGKMTPKVRGEQREGIKISCPIPGHIDSNPSAWINLDKQTWFCGGCQVGGDKYDLAAYRMGFSVPGYKDGADFHRLRERMAQDFGFTVSRTFEGTTVVTPVVEEEEEEPAPVIPIEGEEDDFDLYGNMPGLDWRPICPEGTFLHEYMKCTIIDDAPEEYHFFHALLGIGFALGRDVKARDFIPVYGNLYICTLGRTGTGKSKAKGHLDKLLRSTLPYSSASAPSQGVKSVASIGSAENLVYQFMEPILDPSDPKKVAYYAPVKGLIDFNELSALMAIANRPGSGMKPKLMEFYDMADIIKSSSMGSGNKIAQEPFASLLTTSQPKALRDLISSYDDSSGFLNRWVFVPGTEKTRFAIGGAAVDMRSAELPLKAIQGWAKTFKSNEMMEWSEEAELLYTRFFHNHIEPDKKKAGNDLLVRLDLTIKKLALLFAANRHEKVISGQSVQDAMYCYPYLKDSYGLAWGAMGNTRKKEIREAVVTFVNRGTQKNPNGITKRDLVRSMKRREYDDKELLEALDILSKLGIIEIVETKTTGKVGRPTVRYRHVG